MLIFVSMEKVSSRFGVNDRRCLPTRYVRLGGEMCRYGKVLVCVRRPCELVPADACSGCWFSRGRKEGAMTNCNDIQCSSHDRMDGNNVWFVLKSQL